MEKVKKRLVSVLALLLFYSVSSAGIIKVDDLGDPAPSTGGTLTLRQAVSMASAGDTIIMDVSGQINLTSAITINIPITILGAYPVHSAINGPTPGGGEAFVITNVNADTVVINGFRFSSYNGGSSVISCVNSLVRIGDCVFEGNSGNANGQCVSSGGTGSDVKVFSCSFFNNNAGGAEGGAGFVGSGNTLSFFNCTFFQNNANVGGAISTYGALTIVNNTFINNTAGTGNNISRAAGSSVTLANNIFSNSTGTNAFSNTGANWNNLGGNVHTFNPPAFLSFGSDMTGLSQAGLQLQGTPTTDGYGLKYFRIVAQTSPCVDNGVTPVILPELDCRRAPRTIYGDNSLLPDAGAAEYTMYRVTSTIAPNDFISVWLNMNLSGGFGGPEYMEFDLPGSTNIILGSTHSYTANPPFPRIVDGYTNSGSKIAGPRDPLSAGTYVTPADIHINLIQSTGSVLDIDLWPTGSWIAGLKLDNGPGNGIVMTDCQMKFYGNHVISAAGNGLNGVVVNGFSSDVAVGGARYHEMNVIGGHNNSVSSSGINIGGVNTKVLGNFIGTTSTGLGSLANGVGITVQPNPGTNYIGGIYDSPSRNLISGNLNGHIKLMGPSNTKIKGNIIGTDISTVNGIAPVVVGIEVFNGAAVEIGGLNKGEGNVIGFTNTAAFLMNNTAPATVFGNYIGISPYASNGYTAIPNNTSGIVVIGGNGSVSIGNGSLNGRNYISANNGIGIYLDGANQHLISGNFIGVRPDHTAAGNTSVGVALGNTSAQNLIADNVISGNGAPGVALSSSGSLNTIQNNKIGVDSAGTVAIPNTTGVSFTGGIINNRIYGNIISGNTSYGIELSSAQTNDIRYNIIGLDASQTIAVANGSHGIYINGASFTYIDTNIIAANNGGGIYATGLYDFSFNGNYIGLNASGTFFGNNGDGVFLENSAIGTIGFSSLGYMNTIANNAGAGIKLNGADSITIQNNSIYNNGQLGISINNTTTPLVNDLNDADVNSSSLSNQGQNCPLLNAAQVCPSGFTTVSGTLNVDDPSANYFIEFFMLSSADPSGSGEGDSVIHSATYNAGGFNTINFTENIASVLPTGAILSAACTKEIAAGYYRSSEFSDTISVRGGFTADATVINNILCNGGGGGSAYVTNNSGIGPITYQWYDAGSGAPLAGQTNDTATFVVSGNYYCIVTDGTACSVISDTISITEPAPIATTLNVASETCSGLNDGAADLVVNSGGTPNFTFDWYNSSATVISTTAAINTGSTVGIGSISPGNYFVVITDANGCQDTLTFTVISGQTVNSIYTVSSDTVCAGSTISFTDFSTPAGSISAWDYDFGDATSSTVQNPTHAYSTSGVFTTQLIAYAGTCSDTSNITIVVQAMPTSSAGVDQSVCQGNTITFTGSATNFSNVSWSTNGTGTFSPAISPNTVYTHGASDVGTTIQVYFNANSGNTCPNVPDTLLLTVNALPSAFAGNDTTICSGNVLSLNGTASNAPSTTWVSTGSGTFGNSSLLNTTYTPSAADISSGTVTITLQTSANGACAAVSDALILTINAGPTANAGADVDMCTSGTAFITLSGSVSGASSFSWGTTGTGTYVNGTTTTPDYYPSGADFSGPNTTLYLTAVSAGCPSVTDSLVITYHTPPSATAGPDQTICSGNPVNLSGASATTFASLLWSNGGGTYAPSNTVQNPTYSPTAAEESAGSVQLIFTAFATLACPNAVDTVDIIILQSPTATISGGGTFCTGDPNAFVQVDFTGTGPWQFTIDLNGSADITQTFGGTYVYYPTNSGIYTVSNITDNGTGCTIAAGTGSVSFSIVTAPDSTFGYSQSAFCLNAGTQAPTAATAGGTYSVVQTGLTINTSTGVIDPGTSTPGTYDVIYTITSPCFADDTIQIVINPLPDAGFTTLTPYCAGEAADDFVPNTPGGYFSGPGITDSIQGTFDPAVAGSGTHVITYTITDSNSCTSILSGNIVVNANPAVSITGINSSYCTSDSPVTATGTPSGGFFFLNTTLLPGGYFDPSTVAPGVDTISYAYSDANNCIGIAYVIVTITAGPPPPSASNTTINYCQGSTIAPLTVSATGNVTWYNDSTLTNPVGTGSTLTLPQNLSGVNIFYATQTTGSCTSQPTVITVTVVNGAVLNLGGPFNACPGQPIQLNAQNVTGTINWSPGTTLNDSTVVNPVASPTFTTTYTATTVISGCTVSDSVTVIIDPSCEVYNAFSPNGDGINDTWVIDGVSINPNNRVMIFNRWGDKLVEFKNYNNVTVVWDGTWNGNQLPAGTYFYIIEFIDIQKQFSGWVQLTR
ncbi:MAG: gliding motility-associated C-terminal domain-containing protein [Bacteroidota bacterium]